MRRSFWLTLALASLSALAQAAGIAALQEADVTTLGNTGGTINYSRGWRFTANANVFVNDLGASTPHPQGAAYTLTLWNFASQSVLAQVTATASGLNAWEWTALASPVALTAGNDYIISLWSATSPYYFGATSPGSVWQPTGTIQYRDVRYANSATANTFPAFSLSNYMYGAPDIRYSFDAPSGVPEPSTYAMMLIGGAAAFFIRKRKV